MQTYPAHEAESKDLLPAPGSLISDGELAAILGLSVITLRNWRCTGRGPRWVKIGARAVRYRREDVAQFIAQGASA